MIINFFVTLCDKNVVTIQGNTPISYPAPSGTTQYIAPSESENINVGGIKYFNSIKVNVIRQYSYKTQSYSE